MTIKTLLTIIVMYFFVYLIANNNHKKTQKFLNKNKIQQKYLKTIKENQYNDYSYTRFKKKDVLTIAEKQFYNILKKYIRNEYLIIPQAVLSSFIDCNEFMYRNKINRKTVDFIIVDRQFNVICAIELDDRSHDKYNRKKRDAFVNSLFANVGIKLLRIKMSKNYYKQLEEMLPLEVISINAHS